MQTVSCTTIRDAKTASRIGSPSGSTCAIWSRKFRRLRSARAGPSRMPKVFRLPRAWPSMSMRIRMSRSRAESRRRSRSLSSLLIRTSRNQPVPGQVVRGLPHRSGRIYLFVPTAPCVQRAHQCTRRAHRAERAHTSTRSTAVRIRLRFSQPARRDQRWFEVV